MLYSSSRYDELALWYDLRNGDEEALATLLRLYAKPLISYGRKMISDDAVIEDCIQEVFIQLWQYRCSLKEDVGSVKAYIFASVRRRIITEVKKNTFATTQYDNSASDGYFDIGFSIEEKIIQNETELHRVKIINQHLNSLPKRQKEAIYLKYFKELTNQEIADIMGVKYQTVGNLIHEALTFLRTVFPNDAVWLSLLMVYIN
ncbi:MULTISPECIES: sigma-70 family RNA polymerase sigma factor [Arcicella]|uniref:Sigma-70 family RNA polymerase sigma factor n=1 Tax=Arcicella aquatica TaxID=217141 RepID=A0ABU5QI01_9BACT|nr:MULTISPECIES: sigma-70 family RNA polymerase sigma factor [Arcicella]MDR6560781.1 RNA polymerase sigma factor (sigma-70 family) [Arcicella sp. BE51]MDR6810665.1 RNA polymerase sigma factor (sigma-70 family) [Arcicella sp. BE140]MDR6822015.1 RNA polymerase sigma factor (sigma-70 family) [Arcicella sp. BE139]MEA5256374.1 sigma-70 family RNA polymerase sigma factor [Arcicella aquatica]